MLGLTKISIVVNCFLPDISHQDLTNTVSHMLGFLVPPHHHYEQVNNKSFSGKLQADKGIIKYSSGQLSGMLAY